jgi:excisionase family DNA binding protein
MVLPGRGMRLMTIREIAEFLVLHYDTVLRKAKKGQIPGAFLMGTEWRIRPLAFKSWVERGCPSVRPV